MTTQTDKWPNQQRWYIRFSRETWNDPINSSPHATKIQKYIFASKEKKIFDTFLTALIVCEIYWLCDGTIFTARGQKCNSGEYKFLYTGSFTQTWHSGIQIPIQLKRLHRWSPCLHLKKYLMKPVLSCFQYQKFQVHRVLSSPQYRPSDVRNRTYKGPGPGLGVLEPVVKVGV